MSLINEALKKAQRQRALEAAQTPPATATPEDVKEGGTAVISGVEKAAARPAVESLTPRLIKRRKPTPAQNIVAVVLAVVVLVVAGLSSAVLWFDFEWGAEEAPVVVAGGGNEPVRVGPMPVEPGPVGPVPGPEEAAGEVGEPEEVPPVMFPGLSPVVPVMPVTPVEPEPEPVVVVVPVRRAPVRGPVAPPSGSSAEEVVRVSELQVLQFLDTLRVTASRPSETDPRVLMNDRLFRLGDLVDRELGLRIKAIRPGELIFTDEAGREFTKLF